MYANNPYLYELIVRCYEVIYYEILSKVVVNVPLYTGHRYATRVCGWEKKNRLAIYALLIISGNVPLTCNNHAAS